MTIKSLELETVCGITSKLPQHDKIEMAFWGRSNVGKSSLLNTLWNRKSMARISSQPGKTQTINYYNINDLCYMVDLPGYGYAKISKEIQAKWARMIERYLDTSNALRVVFLLVDIREIKIFPSSARNLACHRKCRSFHFPQQRKRERMRSGNISNFS